MSLVSFASYSLGINALIFLLAAAMIWFAGVRLERYTDAISERTGAWASFHRFAATVGIHFPAGGGDYDYGCRPAEQSYLGRL